MRKRQNSSFHVRRQFLVRTLIYGTLAFLIFAAAADGSNGRRDVSLRDIAFIECVPAKVSGFGLVVGLAGTGDGKFIRHSDESLAATLGHLGIDVRGRSVKAGDVAAVLVQAEVRSGMDLGMTAPVRITALGDATDLAGGYLIPVTLESRDGRFKFDASGPVSVVDNCPLGTAPASALVERAMSINSSVFMTHVPPRDFVIEVRGLVAEDVGRVADLINRKFGTIAKAHSGCDIEINLPTSYEDFDERAGLVLRLAEISLQEVIPDLMADRIVDAPAQQ